MKYIRHFHQTILGKILLSLLGLSMAIAFVLFSSWGNRLIAPTVEKSLTSALSTPITIQEFTLTYNRFHLLFQDLRGNTFSTQGGFSLLTLRMYAHYRLECFQNGGLNPLLSPLKTEGSLSGGISSFTIRGNGTLFGGDILYKIELHRFHLSTLDLKVTKIAYEPLMHFLRYPSKTDTTITGKVALRGFDRRDIDGDISLSAQTNQLTSTPISEDTNESFNLKSLLADKYGEVKSFNINVEINALLEHAGILEPFVGIPLAGELNLKGTLKGDEKLLKLKATSDVAQSETKFTVVIPNLEPSRVIFDLAHGDAEQTFELFTLPSPISGQLSAYAELNATDGEFHAIILKGTTIPKVLQQHYQITQPLIHFDADITANISEKGVHYRGRFKSDLVRMEIDNTTTHDQMLRELLKTLH